MQATRKYNKSLPKRARLIGVVTFVLCVFAGCGLNEFKIQKEKIEPLVQRRASKDELINLLGRDYILYSKGQTNWHDLTEYLTLEPKTRLVSVRQGVAKWPTVMFYSTPDMMTWVFLDENGKVVDFVVGAQ